MMFMLAAGMDHIHKNGIVHRDFKPQNCLLSVVDKNIKIIDFGLAKLTNEVIYERFLVGTKHYMAPEIFG